MDEKIQLTDREQRNILFRLLSYTKPHKKTIVTAFIFLLLTTIGDIVLPIIVKIFIDDYLTPGKLEFQPLLILGSTYMSIQIIKAILMFFQLVKFQELALKIIQQLRIDVFSKVQSLGLKYFDKTPAGSIVSRVTNDTEAIKDMFVTVIATFIQGGFLLLGIFIAMFILNIKLGLLCVVILPLLLFVMNLYRKLSSRFYLDMRERLSQLNAKLSESLSGMGIIQVFRQEKRLRAEFGAINDQHYQAGMKNIKIDSLLLRPAIDLIYILGLIIVLSYFGITSFNKVVEIGVLYAFINYLDRFFEPVNQMMI
ncbi:ABC transporter ATP-binding protein, partial [Neobacillus drentensis]|uniref:ABC transporter ATP-binding protein n=1 Tax=Neobacillus drentensis TaxID=220684 RepID=UPI0030011457